MAPLKGEPIIYANASDRPIYLLGGQKSSSLKLSVVGFLKLIPGIAFRPILHFFARISAQPLKVSAMRNSIIYPLTIDDFSSQSHQYGCGREIHFRISRTLFNSSCSEGKFIE